ncbi:sulfite exporter TauE/SafE family protein [Archaeoglobales archaeon]|nr:MAG: sulfite exporter TauE/SafE family protein [Archaeoglobales archaeon]
MIRDIYKACVAAAQAHARWEYEVSKTILYDKRKLLILGLMLLPVLVVPLVFATDLPPVLGGKKAYAPAFSTTQMLIASLFIGLCAGLITGCIGAGGGFIITPALMSAGVRGILAVGTDMFHIFAKAIMGTAVHRKLGNVSVALAVTFVSGSIIGVTCGGTINRAVYYANPILSDVLISTVCVLLLGFLGTFAMRDYLRLRKRVAAFDGANPAEVVATTKLAIKLQSVHIPPMISFDHDLYPGGRQISAWFVVMCGFVVGFVAAIMGVGGGFLTFPMYVYMLGVSSFTTVGTDIFQIIITAGYASIGQYAIYGFVFYTLAMGLLIGSLIGIQVGALTTKVVKGLYIRGFYATVILAGFLNRLFALPGKLSSAGVISLDKSVGDTLNLIGIAVFFAIVIVFAGWVSLKFVGNLKSLKEE